MRRQSSMRQPGRAADRRLAGGPSQSAVLHVLLSFPRTSLVAKWSIGKMPDSLFLASSDLLLQVLVVPSFPIFEGTLRIGHDPRDNGDHGRAVRRQLPEGFEQASHRSKPIY